MPRKTPRNETPHASDASEATSRVSPGFTPRARLQGFLVDLKDDIPDAARPRSWFSFRGRMTRKAFWLFYLFNIFVISAAAAVFDLLIRVFPGAAEMVLPLGFFILIMGSMIALCGAMVRRVRDAGLPVWIAPTGLVSFFVAITIWMIEGAVYQMNAAQGTLDDWISTRPPLTEGAGAVALIFAAVLFVGLVRRSRPQRQ